MGSETTTRHLDPGQGSLGVAGRVGSVDAVADPAAGANGSRPVPEAPEVGQIQTIARMVLRPVLRFFWRINVEGIENVPQSGPAIIAPNHTSVIDSFFLPAVLPRRVSLVGKSEYLDDWKTRKLFPALGMIPIDRSGGSASERALNTAARALDRGELFAIYPEGTRSRSGKLHKGHTGAARLALRCNAPIVPVGIVGTRDIQPPDAKMPKPFMSVTIRFGRPVDVGRYQDLVDDRMILRQIIDEVMFEIRNLTGQEYDPSYATKPTRHADKITDLTAERASGHAVDPTVSRRSSAELLGAPRAG